MFNLPQKERGREGRTECQAEKRIKKERIK
jgi:hypothetical protein